MITSNVLQFLLVRCLVWCLVWCACGFAGGWIAAKKGYSARSGILVGIFAGPLGLLVAALLPRTREGREQAELERQARVEAREYKQQKTCPECGRGLSLVARVCPRCEHRFS